MYTCVKAGTWVSQSHELPERSRIPEIRRQHCLFGLSFWYQPYAAWALPSKGWVYNDWHLVSAGPWGFPSVSAVKNPPAMQEMQEMWVRSLDWEDPLQESMATHSSILAWRIPWMEEPGGLQSMGSQRIRHDWVILNKRLKSKLDGLLIQLVQRVSASVKIVRLTHRKCKYNKTHGVCVWERR